MANDQNEAQENQICIPGLVKWHKDFHEANVAARQSKKLVFLFVMLGRLDEEFC